MTLLSFAVFTAFSVVGLLHALWALRIWWPLGDEARMAHAVFGAPGVDHMPGAAITWVVVAMAALAALWVALLSGWISPPLAPGLIRLGGWVMVAVLASRGAGSYVARAFGARWEQPFHRLDAYAYSPLILALALAVAVLTLASQI